jgi:predicted  nucleic acid-binding Zn-ribbon protein
MDNENKPEEMNPENQFDSQNPETSTPEEQAPVSTEATMLTHPQTDNDAVPQTETPESPEVSEEADAPEETPPEAVEPPPEEPVTEKPRYKPASQVRAEAGSKKMAFIIMFETLFVVILIGLCGFLLYKISEMKKNGSGIDSAQSQETIQKIEELQSDLGKLKSDKESIDKKLESKENELNTKLTDLENLKIEKSSLEEKISSINAKLESFETSKDGLERERDDLIGQLKPLQTENKQIKDQLNQNEKDKKTLTETITKLKNDIERLNREMDALDEAKKTKQRDFEKLYEEYAPNAIRVIEELHKFHGYLEKGMEIREFVRKLDVVRVFVDEFRNTASKNSKLLSYQLIIKAYNAYQESEENWGKLIRSSLPKELAGFSEKVIKYEVPIREYRPWVDIIQVNWNSAKWAVDAAEATVYAKEDFKIDQCPICQGKHFTACPKCSSSGECFTCLGKGNDETRGGTTCIVCEGSGKCPLCQGKKELPCPVCIMVANTWATEE